MGLIISACNACVCLASCTQCCFNCFHWERTSTRARTKFFILWLCCAFVAWLLRDHAFKQLKKVGGMKDCLDETCTGTSVVLRVTLAMVLLSSITAILVFGVSSSKDPRAIIQNGFFPLRWLIQAGLIVACFFIDNETIINYAYASAACSAIFMLGGILLMLEFAHQWNDNWVEKMDAGEKTWGYAIVGVSALLFSGSIAVWVILFIYFGGPHCDHANVFISVTIVLSVIVTGISLLNVITQGAILPSAVMVAYCTYLLASAVINIPADNDSLCINRHTRVDGNTAKGVYSAGVVITIFCVLYATARLASKGQSFAPKSMGSDLPSANKVPSSESPAEVTADATEDEQDTTEYSYTFFQVIYTAGAMYLGMVLIDWDISLKEETRVLGNPNTWIPMWVKMASQWASYLLYLWTLLAPVILKDRDFS